MKKLLLLIFMSSLSMVVFANGGSDSGGGTSDSTTYKTISGLVRDPWKVGGRVTSNDNLECYYEREFSFTTVVSASGGVSLGFVEGKLGQKNGREETTVVKMLIENVPTGESVEFWFQKLYTTLDLRKYVNGSDKGSVGDAIFLSGVNLDARP